jgi:hypothetical protein
MEKGRLLNKMFGIMLLGILVLGCTPKKSAELSMEAEITDLQEADEPKGEVVPETTQLETVQIEVETATAQEISHRPFNIEPGKYNIMDFPVNIRNRPDLNGGIIGQLQLHDEIEIIENMGNTQTIEGVLQNWYKMKIGNLEGYIWGGYIAIGGKVFDIDGNNKKEIIYHRISYMKKSPFDDFNYWKIIFPNDIFIYINNKRISNQTIEDRHKDMINYAIWEYCDYNQKEDYILLDIGDLASGDWFKIYPDSRIEWVLNYGP